MFPIENSPEFRQLKDSKTLHPRCSPGNLIRKIPMHIWINMIHMSKDLPLLKVYNFSVIFVSNENSINEAAMFKYNS